MSGHASRALPTGPVELKVKVAAWATYLGGVGLLAILNAFSDANLVASLPDAIEVFVAPMLPTAITAFTAYWADHTPRPDLGQQ
jgi:hypothetical protein